TRLCIAELLDAGLMAMLDATPDGQTVYLRLGFKGAWSYRRLIAQDGASAANATAAHSGIARRAPDGAIIRPMVAADWPAVCAYDASAFGTDRGDVLARLRLRLPRAALVAWRDNALAGYLLGRDGRVATQFGPLVAQDDATALALLVRGLAMIPGPVQVDVPDARAALHDALAARGFLAQRPLTRMVLGHAALDVGDRTYAVAGPELS
ncbi:MAG: hypothetical protein HY056_09430, partial [Proteobacteria bacterium]|nr:hypothetical protein [Pseudomonadota bacterium]